MRRNKKNYWGRGARKRILIEYWYPDGKGDTDHEFYKTGAVDQGDCEKSGYLHENCRGSPVYYLKEIKIKKLGFACEFHHKLISIFGGKTNFTSPAMP